MILGSIASRSIVLLFKCSRFNSFAFKVQCFAFKVQLLRVQGSMLRVQGSIVLLFKCSLVQMFNVQLLRVQGSMLRVQGSIASRSRFNASRSIATSLRVQFVQYAYVVKCSNCERLSIQAVFSSLSPLLKTQNEETSLKRFVESANATR